MTLKLYGHPFSSYTQKALIALYENDLPFDFKIIGPEAPDHYNELKRAWPLAKFPLFDNYVMTPMNALVRNAMRAPDNRHPPSVTEARSQLDAIYAWLDERMADRRWAVGDTFTLADCAAAPSLFYADWAHPIAPAHTYLRSYRQRLLARPSYDRANNEARPYRHYFPLGAPDRD
jgi:glutathione S-transferase